MSTTQRSESMNAFFDGYVHSKTSLKQFVQQYKRALRNNVEKEFQPDFKYFSQMVSCATKYEMEKRFQLVYTISKFREVQEEFVGKVYCDLVFSSVDCLGTTYEVWEDVIRDDWVDKKHAITVLLRNNVKSLPDTYVLRKWTRDVVRAHTRIVVNYDGLSSTSA
ncbi:protein FAR-RED ELONGATED HYPOCOTYL 3-like [Olea europaea var. sylvestris]|uniref:protein FAR-RED ELONGATED HYPOCOTYL 3-like n=1 Tax=Olea europaea var. sylvestris TaxID=158386 RepID=UPI000C1D6968|nr:protein FAR-RED ELONGATED HYPOCOTYL 3-like [Olea europaea var. sylvestris]